MSLRPGAPVTLPHKRRESHRAEWMAEIEALMVSGEWIRGKTGKELAQKWSTGYSHVRHMAGLVSARLRAAKPLDILRAEIDETLELIVQAACVEKQFSAAVSAIRLRLEAHGLLTHRIETTHKIQELSDEELEAQLEKHGLRLIATTGEEIDGALRETA